LMRACIQGASKGFTTESAQYLLRAMR
jgi:hypothetical protein